MPLLFNSLLVSIHTEPLTWEASSISLSTIPKYTEGSDTVLGDINNIAEMYK